MMQCLRLALPALLLLATSSIARASFSFCSVRSRGVTITHAPSRCRRPSRFLIGCNSNQVLQSSTTTSDDADKYEYDLWNADISPQLLHQQHEHEWASSILPLPEHANDPSIANRARTAMSSVPAGSSSSTTQAQPPALDGRCTVNSDAFNNGRCKFVHVDPPVLIVDDFLTQQECDEIMQITTSPSPPVGVGRVIQLESRLSEANKSSYGNTAVRRSTTWYVRYGAPQLAPILRGLLQLLPDIQLEQTEEVQLVRYMGNGQGFGWHEDALAEEEATPEAGGQRIATLLVYLDDCQDGSGRTLFRDLREGRGGGKSEQRLGVSPKKGRALLFFPAITTQDDNSTKHVTNPDSSDATAFGNIYFDHTRADHRTTHAGEPPQGNNGQKHIAQLWIHSGVHTSVVFGRGLNKHSEAML